MVSTLEWDGEVRWPAFWSCLTRNDEKRTGVEGPRERSLQANAREDSKPTVIACTQGMWL
jgi:hypothetical protein